MVWLVRTLTSSIGMKWLMALTGLGLFLYVVGHMVGNLLIFAGPDAINAYGVALREAPVLLWLARILLIVGFVLHVFAAFRLTQIGYRARVERYVVKKPVVATYASRTMFWGGVILFAFVFYHLAHFTFHGVEPEAASYVDAQGRHDIYAMVVLGFQKPLISAIYILSMVALALHLTHGVSSAMQTFGARHPKWQPLLNGVGPFFGILIIVGNISIPLAVLAGLLTYPAGGM